MYSKNSMVAAAACAMAAKEGAEIHRVYGSSNIARVCDQGRKNAKNTIAKSKYMPHQGSKEVARRLKQEARAAAKANA